MRIPIDILYGSETGTAQDCAVSLAREARRRGFEVRICAMDSIDFDLGDCTVALFVAATTGQGEEPRNMKRFWRALLRKTLGRDWLQKVNFGVFGLGDSSYAKFNFPAKKLFKRLVQLGAKPLLPRGDGDDQHYLGVDGTFDPWCENLWLALDALFPPPRDFVVPPKNILPPPSFRVDFVEDVFEVSDAPSELSAALVIENNRMTSKSHFQDIRHLSFDISSTKSKYSPADVMTIYPRNPTADIQQVIEFLNYTDIADKPFYLTPTSPTSPQLPLTLTQPTTLRKAFSTTLDIFGRPKRYFFHLLSFFTPDLLHASKLQEFASTEGQEEVYAYAYKLRRTTFEVLQDFHSCRGMIPVAYLFDLVPAMRPRMYSISSIMSSSADDQKTIELTVGIVEYKTRMQKIREGVCSKMLRGLIPGDTVLFKIESGTMRLPVDHQVPAIFVGAGTGIAPLRSLLLERINCGAKENILVVGYRSKAHDYLYGSEFEQMRLQGFLTLIPAFSRDDPEKVIYIQHRMKEHANLLWDAIKRGGHIYVSGNAQRIPKSVNNALLEIFQEVGELDKDEAQAYLNRLERSRQYQSECWV